MRAGLVDREGHRIDGTVRIQGINDLVRSFGRIDKNLRKEVQKELSKAAEIVRDDARARFRGVDARSAMGFRARVRTGQSYVEQRYGRTTGQHPEFGVLQMRRALLPALWSNRGKVEKSLENMLDKLANLNGF